MASRLLHQIRACPVIALILTLGLSAAEKEDIFPLDARHNHASSLVQLPNGDLFVCWYRGSGEREADDVVVMAARKKKGAASWTEPYVLADTPGFPDTNPTLFLDRDGRLWFFWQAIVANRWETAITKMRSTMRWQADPIQWDAGDILLVKPLNIAERVEQVFGPLHPLTAKARDKYFSRLGWMTRAHPTQLPSGRILLPLYSDGYSFSLVAHSDDSGLTWQAGEPIVGLGNIQPSIARRKDGTLVAYMRDNGPPPKRVHISYSKDDGVTWTPAADTDIPNSGTGLEVLVLRDGRWLLINNDTEQGRYSLAVWLSVDEGRTWTWKRHLELREGDSFHYPSVLESPDGAIHCSYSVFLNHLPPGQPNKTIRHATFTPAWIVQGDASAAP